MELVVGDMVRIHNDIGPDGLIDCWPESEGQIGVVIALAKRLHIPAAKVMVLGEVAEFDFTELEKVCK